MASKSISNRSDGKLKARVKELGLESFVSFEGWQNEELFPSYLRSADICISPLHKNPHHDTTLANKLFQYMGFERPLLLSDVLAQADIIRRSGAGMTHKAGDHEDFADKCLRLYRDEDLRKQMGNKGKIFLEEEFQLSKVGVPLLSAYSEIKEKSEI